MRRFGVLALLALLIGCQAVQEAEEKPGPSVIDGTPFVFDVPADFDVKEDESVCSALFGWAEPSPRARRRQQ
jgi:hypothetical protein